MALVVFERARDVGILEDVEDAKSRQNIVAAEFVVGRDVEEQIGRSLAGHQGGAIHHRTAKVIIEAVLSFAGSRKFNALGLDAAQKTPGSLMRSCAVRLSGDVNGERLRQTSDK